MDTWPVGLQQKLNAQGFQLGLGNTRVSSDMSVGPAKTRTRYTDAVDVYTCSVNLSFEEVATFKTFYRTTLSNGTLPFYFNDPFTETQATFRFAPDQDPSITPIGGREFTLNMVWEKLP